MAITGTSNGQDAARRAALIRYAGGQGGQGSAPASEPPMGGAPAPAAGGDVTDGLLALAQRTVSDTGAIRENLSGWKQALSFLAANLPPEMLQGSGSQGAAPPEPVSPAMGQMGAQSAPAPYGRPPR